MEKGILKEDGTVVIEGKPDMHISELNGSTKSVADDGALEREEANVVENEPVKKAEEKDDTAVDSAENTFDVSSFNKHFKSAFKSREEIVELLGLKDKVQDKDKELEKFKSYEKENGELKKRVDELSKNSGWRKYFSDENSFKAEQLIKDNPGVNPNVIRRIIGSDLSRMSPEEVLVNAMIVENEGISYKDASEYISDKFSFESIEKYNDQNSDDYNPERYKKEKERIERNLKIEAGRSVKVLKSFVDKASNIQIDDSPIAEEGVDEKLLAEWEPVLNEVLNIKSLNIPTVDGKETRHVYEIDENFKNDMREYLNEFALATGDVPNESVIKEVTDLYQKEYLWNNFPRILDVVVNNEIVKIERKYDDEIHNPSKPNTSTAPVKDGNNVSGIEQLINKNKRINKGFFGS